jgi:hypothetical protein
MTSFYILSGSLFTGIQSFDAIVHSETWTMPGNYGGREIHRPEGFVYNRNLYVFMFVTLCDLPHSPCDSSGQHCEEVRDSNYDDLATGHYYITMNRQEL